MSKKAKWLLVAVALLLMLVVILPFVLGIALRGKVEGEVSKAVNAPVKLGGLSVSILSPGATLSGLEVGAPAGEAGNQPLAKIEKLSAGVSWGTVLGGDLHVTSLQIAGADIHVGVDEEGRSTLEKFLGNLPASEPRKVELPINYLRVTDSKITMYAPVAAVAPGAVHDPEPLTVDLENLVVQDLVLPVNGQPAAKEVWTSIGLEGLKVRSPLKGVEPVAPPEGAGTPIEEGITLDAAEGQMQIPASLDKPLLLRAGKLSGLKVRNVILNANDPQTLDRIAAFRDRCLKTPATKPGETGMVLGNGGAMVQDFTMAGSVLEIDGYDADGNLSYYRIKDLAIDLKNFGYGKGAEASAEDPGHLKLESPTGSSEGDGDILADWKNIVGTWPTCSFDNEFHVNGVPMTPFSALVKKSTKVGVRKGNVSTEFAGPVTNGKIKWDGSLTLSKDTDLATGEGMIAGMKKEIAKAATGEPLKTFRVRGTLSNPKFEPPDMVAGIVWNVVQSVATGSVTGVLDTFTEGMGAAVDQGVRETKKVLTKIPGIGGIFGGEEGE